MQMYRQKLYKITNAADNYYILALSTFSLPVFKRWLNDLIKTKLLLNCSVFNYVNYYRDCFNIGMIYHFQQDDNLATMKSKMEEVKQNDNGDLWEMNQMAQPNNEPASPYVFIHTDETGDPIVPSQIIVYEDDDEIENDKDNHIEDIELLLHFLDNRPEIPSAPATESGYENNEDSDNDNDITDNFDTTVFYEPPEIVYVAPLPVCKTGFCNICFDDNKGLVKMPECKCTCDNDFTFLCCDCQPKLNKCPMCKYHYD
jgi:hypothetical protein